MGLGTLAIVLSVVCLAVSFVFTVPAWVNLVGVGFGVAGLLQISRSRRDGGNGS